MIIKKRNLYLLTVMLSTIVLSSCIVAYAMADNGVLASEGTDTLVAVTGYTDLNGSFQFPEAGEKVAVLSPSSLPDWSQFEATMDGLREWGYEPVSGKYACVEERTLDDCLEDLIWALEDPEIQDCFGKEESFRHQDQGKGKGAKASVYPHQVLQPHGRLGLEQNEKGQDQGTESIIMPGADVWFRAISHQRQSSKKPSPIASSTSPTTKKAWGSCFFTISLIETRSLLEQIQRRIRLSSPVYIPLP